VTQEPKRRSRIRDSNRAAPQTFAYRDLVRRLTDLERLAVAPEPGERCGQWSSYDRASRYDNETETYVGWYANADGDGFIREEDGLEVLAEMDGPGCIWRMWSAQPESGSVKIYLDGDSEPAIDLPFFGYFDGKNAPFTRPALVHWTSKGWNNYTPIPYQKSCRIVAEPGWGLFYHFTFGTFPEGTAVPTFQRALSPNDCRTLDEVDAALRFPGPRKRGTNDTIAAGGPVTVEPGKSFDAADLEGPQAIVSIRLRMPLPEPPLDRYVLRNVALRITWDNDVNPAVWSPIGDFFGTAPGANPYRSYPLGLTDDGWWYCNWYMPFAGRAFVEIVNDGPEPFTLEYEIVATPLSKPIKSLARFHAKWHRDAYLPGEPERWIDWTMLKTWGRGRFAGVALHVWNPRGAWWGEGDEKFFVDGEKFPSTFGTGSEDYFGYAWCDPNPFHHAFHNQTVCEDNAGHISVNRWQIADDVPFQHSFEGCIEKYLPNERPCLYDCVAYWYLMPGGKDPYREIPVVDPYGWPELLRYHWPPAVLAHWRGILGPDDLEIVGHTGGEVTRSPLDREYFEWGGPEHMFWSGMMLGDELDVEFRVEESARYEICVQLTASRFGPIVTLALDGSALGAPIDLFRPHPVLMPTGLSSVGLGDLAAGPHRLRVTVVGENALRRQDTRKVGLHCVYLDKVATRCSA